MKSDPEVGKASRRQHDLAFKRNLVQQCLAPGASMPAIALRSGGNANILFKWRRDTSSRQPAVLLPIQLAPEVDAQAHVRSPATAPPSRPPARGGAIELEIAWAQLRLRGPRGRGQSAQRAARVASQRMIGPRAGTRVWLAARVTDMRCGMDSLAAKVQTVLATWFVFGRH